MTAHMQHGGHRKGAGRKPLSTTPKVITRSVSMPPHAWAKLDDLRVEQSRGKYIETKLKLK